MYTCNRNRQSPKAPPVHHETVRRLGGSALSEKLARAYIHSQDRNTGLREWWNLARMVNSDGVEQAFSWANAMDLLWSTGPVGDWKRRQGRRWYCISYVLLTGAGSNQVWASLVHPGFLFFGPGRHKGSSQSDGANQTRNGAVGQLVCDQGRTTWISEFLSF